MRIEHIAFNVADPTGMAEWYGKNLGMRVLRKFEGGTDTHFIADAAGRVVLELYRQEKSPVPDYGAMDPMILHVAFVVADVTAERQRLLAAGAKAVGEVGRNDGGDELAMLRDPWGFCVQLVRRAKPMP
jgi:glyoxylase I family protein